MNLIVVLRAVQDPTGLMVNRRAQKVFVNRESYRPNPSDLNALEAALKLGDSHAVTVLGYGGAPAEDLLRDALAMGAPRALWVRDPALQHTDAAVLTRVVQCAVEYLGGADLVLFGADVLDADLAQAAPRLAAALGAAYAEGAHGLRAGAGSAVQAIVWRDGAYRWIETEPPAVISIARDSNQPRYAPAPRLISVYSTPDAIEVVGPSDLGLGEADLTPLTERRGEAFPPERDLGAVLAGTASETARQVADELRRLHDGH